MFLRTWLRITFPEKPPLTFLSNSEEYGWGTLLGLPIYALKYQIAIIQVRLPVYLFTYQLTGKGMSCGSRKFIPCLTKP